MVEMVEKTIDSGALAETLAGRTVVLGITGSIAAVRTIELAHELIRRGAVVQAVMTESAQGALRSRSGLAGSRGQSIVVARVMMLAWTAALLICC
jgi:hypothetical protein